VLGPDAWSVFVPAPHLRVAGTVGALARVPLHTASIQQPLLAGREVLASRASLLAQLQATNWGELGLVRLRSSALRAFASGGISCQVRRATMVPAASAPGCCPLPH
jgi:hypothetical protein